MTMIASFTVFLAVVPAVLQASEPAAQEGLKPAHTHVRHVASAINGTPGGVGLLEALRIEADIALQHAGLAAGDVTDLESMKRHVRHVRHAIDASTEENGPGKGFGVKRAADGVATHIRLAAKSDGSSENIERHSVHVATSAENVSRWCDAILAASEQVLAAETAEAAAAPAQRIAELARIILEGTDADGDGQVSWQQNEGGIAQARQHLSILLEAEGIPETP
jgi:hypothetical protein